MRSLQTKNENGNVDIPTLENHSQEMSRCLSDLIKLFQSNPALARKLEEVTKTSFISDGWECSILRDTEESSNCYLDNAMFNHPKWKWFEYNILFNK